MAKKSTITKQRKQAAEPSRRELLMKLLDYITTEELPESVLEKMVTALEAVMKEHADADSGV